MGVVSSLCAVDTSVELRDHGKLRQKSYRKGVKRPKQTYQRSFPNFKEFRKKYRMSDVLGEGASCVCYKCVDIDTGESFACKVINKSTVIDMKGVLEQIYMEMKVLSRLDHPNIIHLKEAFETRDNIYLALTTFPQLNYVMHSPSTWSLWSYYVGQVLEYVGDGELFHYIVERGKLSEEQASGMVRQIVSAIAYMHGKGVIHRDLKPENILLTVLNHQHKPDTESTTSGGGAGGDKKSDNVGGGNDEDIEIKIIDFGLSTILKDDIARSYLGTKGYLAPEMLRRESYTKAVDMWAVGIVVYVLLCGVMPFREPRAEEALSHEDLEKRYVLRFPKWAQGLSPGAKDLLRHMLDLDSTRRYTAEQALHHPWVAGQDEQSLSTEQRSDTAGQSSNECGGEALLAGSALAASPVTTAPRLPLESPQRLGLLASLSFIRQAAHGSSDNRVGGGGINSGVVVV